MHDDVQRTVTELLVLRAQAGHADALELLARAWQERLVRHAQRLTGRDEAGLDVVQESWIAVARGLSSLDEPARFGPWVYRIVTRKSALWIRQQQLRRKHGVETAAYNSRRETVEPQQDAEWREQENRGEAIDDVREALRRMSREDQALLDLRYVQDFGINDIALALDIPPGTVKSRLFHARQHLKVELERIRK